MSRPLIIYEDSGFRNLLPLTYTRPACRLRCGIVTLWEKLAACYPAASAIVVHARDYIAPVVAEELSAVNVNNFDGDAALFVSGRVLVSPSLAREIPLDGSDAAYVSDGVVVAARVSGARCAELRKMLKQGPLPDGWSHGLAVREIEAAVIKYPWDLIHHNPGEITADFERMGLGGNIAGSVHESAVLVDEGRMHIADGASVHPGAILIAEGGPIYLGPKAKVMAGAVVEGPVAIGAKSSIKMQAKIYEGTTIGEFCKVGGEVEESIFQAYSNKQHDGFLGHAFLGEWINLGADTNNSDLKNNYSTVKVTIDGRQVDSGSLFVGSTIGDHSKCGINTMLNTGTVIGVGCNVYGADFPPKYIPSYCWGGGGGFVTHELAKFLETAERVMARRDRKLTPAVRAMLSRVFELTAHERDAVLS
ncbi:MAG: GlmU family protein [Phycisphaerales bacterium]|nr:GlmU family protein [Phycisphaerales bacterium]